MTSSDPSASHRDAIAIVGMECVFPGARDLAAYWRNIVQGVDAIREVPPSRWDAGDYDLATSRGGFIDGLTEFDPLPLGIMPTAVEEGDPEQFLTLSVIHRALLDAQQGRQARRAALGRSDGDAHDDRSDVHNTKLRFLESPERTEVVIGRGGYLGNAAELGYLRMEVVAQFADLLRRVSPDAPEDAIAEIRRWLSEALPPASSEKTASAIPNLTAGRVANRLGLMGANYVVDAACASALVAVDQIAGSLRTHRCDLGIAAGVHLVQKPHFWLAFQTLHALSPSGRLRAFSAEADGLLIGEGIGVVVLKRLHDAERDGDRIYAVIRGVGVSSDGRGASVMAPRQEGEVLAIRRAYEDAGVDPQTVTLIEGHGTAMLAGDATEIAALHQVFGKEGYPAVALGSVKSMIGHTMPAAGAAGLIKAALALYHRVLPPTLHAEPPHPALEGGRLYLNTTARTWISPTGSPRRAGVNAFGFGGINCHVVLEEGPAEAADSLTPRSSELFLIASETRASLVDRLRAWEMALAHRRLGDEDLPNVAFTEAKRFSHAQPARLAIVATSIADLVQKIVRARARLEQDAEDAWSEADGLYFGTEPSPGKMAFLFPGIGFPGLAGGYTTRLGELCLHFPEVRQYIDFADGATADDSAPYPLRHQFFAPPSLKAADLASLEKELAWSERTPMGMMIANLATWNLLLVFGLRPDAIAGFSLGEWSALVAAGVLDGERLVELREVVKAEAARGEIEFEGTWAMVAAPAEQVEAVIGRIPGTISLTMDVSPTQVFIGGEVEAVQTALQRLQEIGVWGQELPFPPVHTPLGAPVVERAKTLQSQVEVRPPIYPVYSGLSGRLYPHDPEDIRALIMEGFAAPVRIRETIRAMYDDGVRIFVQLGSGGKLLTNIQNTLALQRHVALSIDLESRGGLEQLHHLLGRLAALGVPFSPEALFEPRSCQQIDLSEGQPPRKASRLLALDPPRWQPGEHVMERIRHLVVPSPATQDSGQAPAPRPSPVSSSAAPPDGARHPLQESMETLQRFLQIQQQHEESEARLLRRYLEAQQAAMAAFLSRAAAPAVAPPREYPLVGEILHIVPGQELRSRLTLDLDAHPFLADHTFIRAPASLRAVEELLPTLPLTVGAEILAEAAATLVPDLAVHACHDVEATRWIALEDARTLRLEITAQRTSENEVQVTLRPEGQDRPALRGQVTLGRDRPPPPQPMALTHDQPCPHTGEELYSEGRMFHGPRFQVVTALLGMSQDAIAAELVVRDPQELFAAPLAVRPFFDPVLIDGLGQVVGYMAQLDGWAEYPTGIRRLTLHGPAPPPGVTVRAVIRYRRLDARTVEADIDVFDPAGRVWLRVDGWRAWRLLWPKRLQEFIWNPRGRSLGTPWPTRDPRATCYRITHEVLGEINPDWIARTYVGGEEWDQYRAGRRLDWLLGRVAAHDAVRDWLRRHRGVALHPLEVRIANHADGQPVVVAPAGLPVVISISHLEDEAIALVAEAAGAGVDLVRVAERAEGFPEMALDEEELAILNQAGQDRSHGIHRLWAAKEAAAKASGAGLEALPAFRVRGISPEDGRVEIQARPSGRLLNVDTQLDQDRVIAIAVIDERPG